MKEEIFPDFNFNKPLKLENIDVFENFWGVNINVVTTNFNSKSFLKTSNKYSESIFFIFS